MAKKPKNKPASPAAKAEHGKRGTLANIGTGLIANEIILRSVGRLARQRLEKAGARRRVGAEEAEDIVENRSLLHKVAAFGVTSIATRSVPGALLVGGGLLAKNLFDRGTARRKSRRATKRLPATKSVE